jgi:hypothetical protein
MRTHPRRLVAALVLALTLLSAAPGAWALVHPEPTAVASVSWNGPQKMSRLGSAMLAALRAE